MLAAARRELSASSDSSIDTSIDTSINTSIDTTACAFICGVAPAAGVDGALAGPRDPRQTAGGDPGCPGMTTPGQATTPTAQLAARQDRARLSIAALGRTTRVAVQWGHCSQAVGADAIYHRLTEALAGRRDVGVIAAGCDGACFAATQVVVQRPDGSTSYFDRVDADDDLAVILASVAGADDAGTQYPSPDLEAYFTPQHIALTEGIGSVDPASLDEWLAGGGYGGLAAALAMPPDAVIRVVLDAGLLGRGGAFFPAARKWQAARGVAAQRVIWWSTPRKANRACSRTATSWRAIPTALSKAP